MAQTVYCCNHLSCGQPGTGHSIVVIVFAIVFRFKARRHWHRWHPHISFPVPACCLNDLVCCLHPHPHTHTHRHTVRRACLLVLSNCRLRFCTYKTELGCQGPAGIVSQSWEPLASGATSKACAVAVNCDMASGHHPGNTSEQVCKVQDPSQIARHGVRFDAPTPQASPQSLLW